MRKVAWHHISIRQLQRWKRDPGAPWWRTPEADMVLLTTLTGGVQINHSTDHEPPRSLPSLRLSHGEKQVLCPGSSPHFPSDTPWHWKHPHAAASLHALEEWHEQGVWLVAPSRGFRVPPLTHTRADPSYWGITAHTQSWGQGNTELLSLFKIFF